MLVLGVGISDEAENVVEVREPELKDRWKMPILLILESNSF
jgi:hypothetical protein